MANTPTNVTASPPGQGARRDLTRSVTGLVAGVLAAVLADLQYQLPVETQAALVATVTGLSSAGLAAVGKRFRQDRNANVAGRFVGRVF